MAAFMVVLLATVQLELTATMKALEYNAAQ